MALRKALLIGINYRGTSNALNGCINDVDNVREAIVDHFGAEEVCVLTDDGFAVHKDHGKTSQPIIKMITPTKKYIIDSLKWLVDVPEGSSIYLHYSGHGSYTRDRDGDEADGRDEALVPLDYQSAGLLRDDELNDILVDQLPTGVRLFAVLDCCHSGTGMDLRHNIDCSAKYIGKGGKPKAYDWREWDARLTTWKNRKCANSRGRVIMLSGCQDKQTSADAWEAGEYQGALTYGLITILRMFDYNLKWRHLLQDIRCLLKMKGYSQVPKLSADQRTFLEESFGV